MTREELVNNLTDFISQEQNDDLATRTALEFVSSKYTDEERLEITNECIVIARQNMEYLTDQTIIDLFEAQLNHMENCKQTLEGNIRFKREIDKKFDEYCQDDNIPTC